MKKMSLATRNKLESSFDSRAALAKFVGKTPPMATYWLNLKRRIPDTIARKLADKTGIDFYDLRPDLK